MTQLRCMLYFESSSDPSSDLTCFSYKGPVKLMQRVKIAHSFLHSMLNCSTLSFSACLGSSTSDCERIFGNPLLKVEKWPHFFIYSQFQLTMKVGFAIKA